MIINLYKYIFFQKPRGPTRPPPPTRPTRPTRPKRPTFLPLNRDLPHGVEGVVKTNLRSPTPTEPSAPTNTPTNQFTPIDRNFQGSVSDTLADAAVSIIADIANAGIEVDRFSLQVKTEFQPTRSRWFLQNEGEDEDKEADVDVDGDDEQDLTFDFGSYRVGLKNVQMICTIALIALLIIMCVLLIVLTVIGLYNMCTSD